MIATADSTTEVRIAAVFDALEAHGNAEGTEAQLEAAQSMLRAVLEATPEDHIDSVLKLPEIAGFLDDVVPTDAEDNEADA